MNIQMNWYRAPCCASCINHEAPCLCKCEKAQLGTQHRAQGIMLWAIELLKYIPWPNFSRKSRFEIPFYYGKQVYSTIVLLGPYFMSLPLKQNLSLLAWLSLVIEQLWCKFQSHWQENKMFLRQAGVPRILQCFSIFRYLLSVLQKAPHFRMCSDFHQHISWASLPYALNQNHLIYTQKYLLHKNANTLNIKSYALECAVTLGKLIHIQV